MELGAARQRSCDSGGLADRDDDRLSEQRLNTLIILNAEIAHERGLYRNDLERRQAFLMRRPIQSGKAFAYFGLMIGSLPPLTLAIRFIAETMPVEGFSRLFVALLAVTGLVAGALGYVTGHLIPPVIRGLETYRFPNRIVLWSIVGFLWGAVSGGAGGVFLFLIGSIFAAIAGGLVGAVTLPIMTMFYSLLRCGDAIERDHFLPIALGITFSLCALLLGL